MQNEASTDMPITCISCHVAAEHVINAIAELERRDQQDAVAAVCQLATQGNEVERSAGPCTFDANVCVANCTSQLSRSIDV